MLRRKFAGTPGKPGMATVMVDAFNVMQDRITRARLAGDPFTVLIAGGKKFSPIGARPSANTRSTTIDQRPHTNDERLTTNN